MEPNQRDPAQGRAGPRKSVHVGASNRPEDKPSLIDYQIQFVSRRFAVPLALATAVAELAFANVRRE
jgi:hypothetical protein